MQRVIFFKNKGLFQSNEPLFYMKAMKQEKQDLYVYMKAMKQEKQDLNVYMRSVCTLKTQLASKGAHS